MLEQVRRTIESHRMFAGGGTAGVAVSGGADSVGLFYALNDLAAWLDIRLHVLHINHGLRGEESDEDARFVADLAGRLGWPCTIEPLNLAESDEPNLEQAGRDARIAFFNQVRRAGIVNCIATGHTRSDQAETVLYRLLRGSGTTGLSGIRPVTETGLVRPMLDCSRGDVERYLLEKGTGWREDRTNADLSFVRNRIRHRLLPILVEEFSPAVAGILADTSAMARDEEDFWRGEVVRLAPLVMTPADTNVMLIETEKLHQAHPALARRLLRHALQVVKGDLRGIDLSHVNRVLALARQAEGHGRMQLPGLDIFRSFEWLRIAPPRVASRSEGDYCISVDALRGRRQEYRIPFRSASIFVEVLDPVPADDLQSYNTKGDCLDSARLSGRLELRNWHPGDELDPAGRKLEKIKFLFQEFRIPLWERHLWPVLTAADKVVWALRFGSSQRYKPAAGTTRILRISEMPAQ